MSFPYPPKPWNDGQAVRHELDDGIVLTGVYEAEKNVWHFTRSTVSGGSGVVTTADVFTLNTRPLELPDPFALTDDPSTVVNQQETNWYLYELIKDNPYNVWFGPNPPNNGEIYKFWYDTTRLELFINYNGVWFPVSVPPKDYDVEVNQLGYSINRLEALAEETYAKNVQQDGRLDGIDNDIIELEEEIEALAPSFERGQWNYKQILENRAYSLFDTSGQSTDMFNNVGSIYVSTIDANGNPHGFNDVVTGSYIEIFNDTDADFGLYVIKGINDKSNMNPGYWIFTVDFIKSNRLPSRANGLARFKFFEAPEAAIGPTPAYIRTGPLSLDTPVDNSNLNVSPDRKTLVVRNRTDSIDNNTNFYISDTRYLRVSKDAFEAAFPGGIENYTFMPGQMVYYAADHRQTAASLPMNMGAFLAISWKYHPDRWYEIEVSGSATNNHHYKYPQNKYIEDPIYDHFLSFGCFWRNS